jgi:hypothetical protein
LLVPPLLERLRQIDILSRPTHREDVCGGGGSSSLPPVPKCDRAGPHNAGLPRSVPRVGRRSLHTRRGVAQSRRNQSLHGRRPRGPSHS